MRTKSKSRITTSQRPPAAWSIHPGEILREEFLAPLDMSAYALARALRLPVPRINDIAREKRGITVDTAMRLARYFGTSEQFWLNLQNQHDLWRARGALRAEIAAIRPRSKPAA